MCDRRAFHFRAIAVEHFDQAFFHIIRGNKLISAHNASGADCQVGIDHLRRHRRWQRPAVQAVVDAPEDMGPALPRVLLCPNTLRNNDLSAPAGAQVLPMGAVDALARMQQGGWVYIRS